ncbi:MAG TPA: heme biosynthesis HemY N-terminal domain-containing protein [Burkholderiaceae bacterium]|nr:heme biosynthesis HemY N-terminal domain-containing protein [Burkholderiaceae bacterium]
MRWLTWALVLALLAAAAAMLLQVNAGNVAFLVPPYRLDVSFNLFLLALAGVLLLVYWGARMLQRVVDFPEQVRLYRARREEVGGQQALVEAVRSLLEGRFARAERAARAAQSSARTSGVAALIGARAAHRMQEYERRDEWLSRAEDSRDVDTARLVSSAEMWSEQRHNDAALEAIDRLQGAGARHIHAMRIALNANLQSGRWDEALKALRSLEKRSALHPVLARKLKLAVYREQLLAQRFDPASLEAAWGAIAPADRVLPDVALEGARLLNVAGRGGRAAEAIEQALRLPRAEWDETCQHLLDEYARAQSFPARDQLERVERWLAESPREDETRAVLLRTAGLLCLREQLWGKAKSYLQDSLQIAKHPATLVALARLAELVGDDVEAAQHYREAALGFSQPAAGVADLARPGLREHAV